MSERFVFANKAATDLSAKDGYCAKYDSGMNVTSAITDHVVGIITKGGDTTSLQTEICMHGECVALLGGTVTAGQHVGPHTDGTTVVTAGSGNSEYGIAMESGVAGDYIKVFVLGQAKQYA